MDQNLEPIAMQFDRATVELEALERSVYALADLLSAEITTAGPQYACVIYPRRQSVSVEYLKHRIRTEVNDQTLRLKIARATEPVRNLIFAVAFSRTGLSEPEESNPPSVDNGA